MIRRKLFFVAIIVVLITLYADMAGFSPENPLLAHIEKEDEIYEGIVKDIEKEKEGYKFTVALEGAVKYESPLILISYYKELAKPYSLYKKKIRFAAYLDEPAKRRNPGCFDYGKYLRSKGIYAVATVKNFEIIEDDESRLLKLERKLIEKKYLFTQHISGEVRGLTAGILFGDTSYLEEETYENFKINGTAHVLAVSGLHISILYNLIKRISGKRLTRLRLLFLCATLMTAGILASWTPSVIRASGMILLKSAAEYYDRKYDFLSAMSAVMIILIIKEPLTVLNTGFQMSFLAAASIAFFLPHISSKIPESVAVMFAVNAGLIPYQIFVFNSFSLTSFAANIPVVYIVGILMPFAVVYFILFCLGIEIEAIEYILKSLVVFTEKINEISAMNGKGAIDVISPPVAVVVLFYMAIFFAASETFEILRLRREWKKIILSTAVFAAVAVIAGGLCGEPISQDEVVFVDVGQGDCIHIRDKETDVLIDGGGSVNYKVGNNILKPYLLKNGCRKVDMAIATHLHTDHYKGIQELNEAGMIDKVVTKATAGTNFRVSEDVYIETLWPIEISNEQDENENCSVFMVNYEGYRILITGDLDIKGEKDMIEFYEGTDRLKADILKIGHHGSKDSTCDEFLEAVSPKVCVIQVGKNNYGHPAPKIIENCHKNCIILLRNDIHGAIGFSFGETVEYHVMTEEKVGYGI